MALFTKLTPEEKRAAQAMRELAESTREEMRQINESMSSGFSRFVEEMNESTKRHREMMEAFNESLRPRFLEELAAQAAEHQKVMQGMAEAINVTGRTFGALSQSLIDVHASAFTAVEAVRAGLELPSRLLGQLDSLKTELPNTLRAVSLVSQDIIDGVTQDLETMHESGWWMVDEIVGHLAYSAYRRALREERTEKTFSRLMSALLRENEWKVIKDLKKRWQGHTFIDPRRLAIIFDAVDAHVEGKYTLSIPTLLPQIEFFVKEVLAKKNEAFEELKPSKVPSGTYIQIMHIHAARYFYANILFMSIGYREKLEDEEKKFVEKTNRHLTLHGENPDYPDEGFSTKLILYLDKVFRLINGETD